jgi:uncharacterized protein YjbI with pentapeptide repeats
MSKRWAALPRGIRWTIGGIAAVVLVVAVAWVLFVPAADWLARHDVGSAKGAPLQTARDAARGRLLTLGAGLFAAGALVFTARNFTLSRRTVELSRRTVELSRRTVEVTEQGRVTDRYTKAIEQLGSDKLDVRIGGIYALERVARGSARDHPTVMEVLTAFVREHSREPWPRPADAAPAAAARERVTRPDVQAAVTVIGRRNARHDIPGRRRIDLTGADLTGADLTGALLPDADLTGADLTRADLTGAHLTRARLTYAHLTDAHLPDADLTGADLTRARLTYAHLTGADLTGATLTGATLTRADLTRATLDRADLTGADLIGADLIGADLTGADLSRADLTGAHLTGALMEPDAVIPEGWQRDTDSGRLKRADTSAGGTATN